MPPGSVYYYGATGEVTCGTAQRSGADGVLVLRLETVPLNAGGVLYVDPTAFDATEAARLRVLLAEALYGWLISCSQHDRITNDRITEIRTQEGLL